MHSIRRNQNDQSGCTDGDSAFGKFFPELFDGAGHALLRGFGADTEQVCHFPRGFLFEIAEQDGVSIGFG